MTGIVAAGHPETAAAAAVVLDAGGNAVDAALAGLAAACVAEPVLASLGGGGFLVSRPATGRSAGRTLVHDFFVQTPRRRVGPRGGETRNVEVDFGPERQAFRVGGASVATPGVVRGMFAAHEDAGSAMPLREIFAPACALARGGVVINETQARLVRMVAGILAASADGRRLFGHLDRPDSWPDAGDVLRLPELADVLETLAIEGADLFHRGELSALIADACAHEGGSLARVDLEAYRCERRTPLLVEALGARIETLPPPAAGGAVVGYGLSLYDLLARTGWPQAAVSRAGRVLHVQKLMNALAGRTQAAAGVVSAGEHALAAHFSALLASTQATRGTTHVSVIDGAGGLAALSVSNGEGSGVFVPGTGIQLNNMLGEDALVAAPYGWPTDCRLASMMAPALIHAGDGTSLALGSGGSKRIRSAMLQVALNLLDRRMPPADAVAAPRLHLDDDRLSLEPGFAEAERAELLRAAATVEEWPEQSLFFGGVHVVRRDAAGGLAGAGDDRRGGAVRFV